MLDMTKWQENEIYRSGYLHGWYDRAVEDEANYQRYFGGMPPRPAPVGVLGAQVPTARVAVPSVDTVLK